MRPSTPYGPCPRGQLATVARWAEERRAPLHVHLSEQTAENDACRAAHGCTPTRLLADHGVLGPRTTGVHNTHLTDEDIALLGDSTTGTCMCPTTERDLADGIGPAAALQTARARRSPSAPTATPSSTCSKRRARWS